MHSERPDTKIRMLCDANDVPMCFLLSGVQVSDIAYTQPLLDEVYIPSLPPTPTVCAADGYWDAEALRRYWIVTGCIW
jgi:hypothetical protein